MKELLALIKDICTKIRLNAIAAAVSTVLLWTALPALTFGLPAPSSRYYTEFKDGDWTNGDNSNSWLYGWSDHHTSIGVIEVWTLVAGVPVPTSAWAEAEIWLDFGSADFQQGPVIFEFKYLLDGSMTKVGGTNWFKLTAEIETTYCPPSCGKCSGNPYVHTLEFLTNKNDWSINEHRTKSFTWNLWDQHSYRVTMKARAECESWGLFSLTEVNFMNGSNDIDWERLRLYYYPASTITIAAFCFTEHEDPGVSVIMDGSPTGETTPYTIETLSVPATFTVPDEDPSGHPFVRWHTGDTSTTITVHGSGEYIAFYNEYPLVPLPTLTEWGLIILTATIFGIGVLLLRRRRMA